MDEIKGFGLIICILMVLMAYLKQMIPRGKTMLIMRLIITVFILASIFDGIKRFDFSSLGQLAEYSYSNDDDVWLKASEAVADGLLSEFKGYLEKEGVSSDVISVEVSGDRNGFEVKRVILSGTAVNTAKMMLAARYHIEESCIEVMYE